MRHYLTALLVLCVLLGCKNEQLSIVNAPDGETDPRWIRIDSLANRLGLYASALAATDTVLKEAQDKGDQQQEFRALMYRARFRQNTGVDRKEVITELEQRASTAGFPLKPLLQSVIAEQYWNYYQQNRWRILDRTDVEAGDDADPATWDQQRFMRKVIGLHRASLEQKDSLKATPVGSISRLLIGDERARELRPTLFDLLAHRALDVFTNSETRLAEPAWRFRVEGASAFSVFEDFSARPYQHRDSTSWEFQAMRLFQELERAHLSDTRPGALVDVTLQRLLFVRERSTHARKDSLYLEALEKLGSRMTKDECLGEVLLAQARWHFEMSNKYQRLLDTDGRTAPWKNERRTALALCDEVITRFGRSFAARNASALRGQVTQRELTITTESAVLPSLPFKAGITWRNTKKVWLRLVKDEWSTNEYLERGGYNDGEKLTGRKPIHEWTIELPDDGDLNQHVSEVGVDGLPYGQYVLIACDSSSFKQHVDHISFTRIWVTRMAMSQRWQHGNLDLLVVDRSTGAPKQGVQVIQWMRDYRTAGNAFERSTEPMTTGTDGFVRTHPNGRRGNIGWELIDGDDRYISGASWVPNDYEGGEPEELRTFLFTDRAIYRPGQPVMFKGIVTRRQGKNNEVVPNHRTRVEFFDVNGEKVDSLTVTTDAYGSFHGTFTAPNGTLTGSMTLREEHGERSVQVEEYKRPTFEVAFDLIKGQPKLGAQASVTGQAKSYAGAPLDGAQVQWTVKRGARMPWWCDFFWRGWLPWGEETEIANGISQCDSDGRFTVSFTALADDRFPQESDPSFFYTVDASATDINGETQSSTTSLTLGYRTIDIDLGLAESVERNAVDSLALGVRNLNGQQVDVPLDVRVHRLQAPLAPLRDRLWERPDRFVMSREEHASRFPQDVYNNENDPLSWSRGAQVFEEQGWVAKGKKLPFRQARNWEVGSYLIEAKAKDESGKEVRVSKAFTVYDTSIQNSGFASEAFHAEPVKVRCEPGEKASLLISSQLREAHVLMEVERNERIVVSRWFNLSLGQQLIELPVMEDDRGGFAVHLTCAVQGREHSSTQWIDVPWTNKELKAEWMSFRDKLRPGDQEEWRLRITGTKGEQVTAQLLGAMYDASLDHFVPHGWNMDVWPTSYAQLGWQRQEPFGAAGGQAIWVQNAGVGDSARVYPELNLFGNGMIYGRFRGARAYGWSGATREEVEGDAMSETLSVGKAVACPVFAPTDKVAKNELGNGEVKPEPAKDQGGDLEQPLRSDFRETAFFFPDLLTDRDGSIVLRFKTPDALTRWKVLGLAHTKDLKLVSFSKETVTQKPLMVVPNLPRFLREGDRITLTAKINLIEGKRAEGTATLDLYDPFTNASLNKAFGLQINTHAFVASPGASAVVEWSIVVPEGVNACGVRITAKSAGGPRSENTFADGEERVLPVLTDRMLVTESMPLWISKAGTKTFTLDKLKNTTSPTLKHQSLKLEYTPNPAWYAVQALPYLMEFPHECAEQTFSRYYANALAAHIVKERPAIRKVFEQWRAEKDAGNAAAFLSNLEKNQELKSALLAETPWVLNARSEHESKERIGLLFDLQRMSKEQATALAKLRDMQLPNGAWPWWSGMSESRYITEHIVAGAGHLEKLNATGRGDGPTQEMLKRAVAWLDQDVARDYQEWLKRTKKEDLDKFVPGSSEIHFLYARSFFLRWSLDESASTALNFYRERLRTTWLQNGLQEQAMAALALERLGDKETARAIMRSLSERATRSEELGMYWKDFSGGFYWWSFPAETYALMIEVFHEVSQDEASVNGLRTYLLKLKQTTDWKTTKATADACYALLLTGNDWLKSDALPAIKVGEEVIVSTEQEKAQAGFGTIERTWSAAEIKPAMGTVTITSKADKPSWGALHWQYFERMDRITPHESPFSLKKEVMLTEQKDGTTRLVPLNGARKLKPGDKLTIRIELRTDRYVDYVHLKDLRAAGLEPTETLSGYRYKGGLGYYQSMRDASANFFFDRIPPGTHVFEYTLRVTHEGEFSNGITTAQCMYAPEFASHSEGLRVKVDEE